MEKLGKITENKVVSLQTSAKITPTLILPITMYKCKSWTVKKAERKNVVHLNTVLEEISMDPVDHQNDKQVGPGGN